MRGLSKGIVNVIAGAAVVASIVAQPALAGAKASERGIDYGSLIRTIVQALEEIHISLPPG